MKFFKSVVLVLVFAPTSDAFLLEILNAILGLILTPYIALVAPGICDSGVTALSLDDIFDCTCSGSYQNFSIVGTVDCGPKDSGLTCVGPGDTLCSRTDFGASFQASGAGISGTIEACFAFETGLPEGLSNILQLPNPLCLAAVTTGLAITDCEVTLGSYPCTCDVCNPNTDGGFFKYDCSTVDLAPGLSIFIPGPKADECVGLAFNSAP